MSLSAIQTIPNRQHPTFRRYRCGLGWSVLSDAVSRIFNRGIKMRKVRFAAALVLIGTAWVVVAAANQRVAAPQIDPLQMTLNAKDLPSTQYLDYTFVFN